MSQVDALVERLLSKLVAYRELGSDIRADRLGTRTYDFELLLSEPMPSEIDVTSARIWEECYRATLRSVEPIIAQCRASYEEIPLRDIRRLEALANSIEHGLRLILNMPTPRPL